MATLPPRLKTAVECMYETQADLQKQRAQRAGPEFELSVTLDPQRDVTRYTEVNKSTGEKRCIEIDNNEVYTRKLAGLPDNPFDYERQRKEESHDDKADSMANTRPAYTDASYPSGNSYSWPWPDPKGNPYVWPDPNQSSEKTMANKFLPFIVETSTPLHIFKTMLSRSKGMNVVVLASVFNLVLTRDISALRDIVKDMPDMALEKLYEELLIKFPGARLDARQVDVFQGMVKWFPEGDHWIDDLKQFEEKDVMLFFLAMCHASMDIEPFTNAPFASLVLTDPSETYAVLDNLPEYVKFSDDGDHEVLFKNSAELRTFILYEGLIKESMVPDAPARTYRAVFKNGAEL